MIDVEGSGALGLSGDTENPAISLMLVRVKLGEMCLRAAEKQTAFRVAFWGATKGLNFQQRIYAEIFMVHLSVWVH